MSLEIILILAKNRDFMKNMSKKAEKKLTKSQSYFPNSKKPSPTFFLARVVTGQNLTSESLSVVRAVSVVEDEGEKSYAQNRNSLTQKSFSYTCACPHGRNQRSRNIRHGIRKGKTWSIGFFS